MSYLTRRSLLTLPLGVAGSKLKGIPRKLNEGQPPNILLIIADDMAGWVLNHPGIKQFDEYGNCIGSKFPNIHRLASSGITFSHACVSAPVCNASRTALLSGLSPTTTGVYDNGQPGLNSLKVTTLPQHFARSNYHVIGGGKLGHEVDGGNSTVHWIHGYQRYNNEPTLPVGTFRRGNFAFASLRNEMATQMPDYGIATWVSDALMQSYDKPFLMGAGFKTTHLPFCAPEDNFRRFPLEQIQLPTTTPNDLDDIPRMGISFAKAGGDHTSILARREWHKALQAYLACTSFLDDQLGRVLDALEVSPYRDNTVVIFAGDNGMSCGQHGHWRKFDLWAPSCEVPLIVSLPGASPGTRLNPGTECVEPIELVGFFRTLIELACITPPNDHFLEGESFVPQLLNPLTPRSRPALTTFRRGNHVVQDPGWRLIRYADFTEELYYIGEEPYGSAQPDPYELRNLVPRPFKASNIIADPLIEAVRAQLRGCIPPLKNQAAAVKWPANTKAEADYDT